MYDLIIRNGTIVDGTGKDKYPGDVAIQGDRIAALGDMRDAQSAKTINAEGKYVMPGYIDPHSHGDLNMLIWPESEAYVMQGVTTTVCGNCGFSPAPIKDVWTFAAWEYRLIHRATPQYYTEISFFHDIEKMKAGFKDVYDYDIDYENMGEFFRKADSAGFSVNYYPFVGHNNIRTAVMGMDCLRPAAPAEIERMKALLKQEMEAGCRGLSTGLDYPPGVYGTTEEIIELAKVAKACGGSYISHFRASQLFTTGKLDMDVPGGIREAIKIGKETGIRVHLAHMLPAFTMSPNDPLERKIEAATIIKDIIDEALAQGVKISYDVIPNTSGGGCTTPNLGYLFRPWILASGSYEQFLKNIEVADYAEMLKRDAACSPWFPLNSNMIPDLGNNYHINESCHKEYAHKTLGEIMKENDWDAVHALLEILKADPDTKLKPVSGVGVSEEWLKEILDHPYAMPSSDGFSYNRDAEIGLDYPLDKKPHPNNFCYAIRYLTRYQKERIEDTVRMLTGLPAEIFDIKSRGTLEQGNYADIAVFTEDHLNTNENYSNPAIFPDGIDYVIINGKLTGEDKKHTGAKAGKILKANS
jgi:N-acyl-D-aspartate/D-glutamate deacylase